MQALSLLFLWPNETEGRKAFNTFDMRDFLKNVVKKKVSKWIIKSIILPCLPVILGILVVMLILLTIYGAMFSGSPVAGGDTNLDNIIDETDKEVIENYKAFADNWNIYNTWLDTGEGGVQSINEFLDSHNINTEHISEDIWMDIDEIVKHNEEHQTYGSMINVHELIDRDGKDKALINNWGTIQSYISWWMLQHSETVEEIPEKLFEEFIKEMHPKFKYRTSIRTDCYWVEDEENGGYCACTYTTEYLLIEADTMRGHFAYEYEWYVTYDSHGCETSYEVLANTIDLSPNGNRWYKLEQWLVEHFEIPESDAQDVRLAFINAETAFYEESEVIAWMLERQPYLLTNRVPLGSVPFYIQEICREAAEKYGIPYEILMAIAHRETGGKFDPTAYNPTTGATGLMQFLPSTWEAFKVDGNGDGEINIYNAADAIHSAANYLRSLAGKDLDLRKDKNLILEILAQYGGNPLTQEAKSYATAVYNIASRFNTLNILGTSGYVFPLRGKTLANITSGYEMRYHPTKGVYKMHTGIDLSADMGEPVYAVCAGIVYLAGWYGDYGITVKILGQDQLLHMYCHLSSVAVKSEQQVEAGMLIGYAGSTGESTGPHLHYEVRRSPYNYGDDINPISILQQAKLY